MIESDRQYLRQIAGELNVYSCFSTCVLNGLMDTEHLDAREGLQMQQEMMRDHQFWFPRAYWRNGKYVRPFGVDVQEISNLGQIMLGKYLPIDTIFSEELHDESDAVIRILHSGSAIVLDDSHSQHAYLMLSRPSSYRDLPIVDPFCPDEELTITPEVALKIIQGSRYATLVG